jgi:hypothetical protein
MNSLDYLLYDAYSDHITASKSLSITNGFIRNSQHLQNSRGSVLVQSTGIEMKRYLGATAALKTEITFQKLLGRCANTT